MNGDLGRPAWMTAPSAMAVMDALEAAGGVGCARFVGGCVRNAVLGVEVDDVDIAVVLLPDQTVAALEAAGLKAIPTGIEHGTVTAVAQGRPYEITTLRRDVETDGRRAVVAFTADWRLDAERRDFTLNALYADRTGAVFDPVGSGLSDARAGRIVFVGDAATRIREDYLRILRFFRFHAWYGRGEADPAALAACGALKDGMGRLAAERITKELLKLLGAPDPRLAVRLMAESGVLAEILPGVGDVARFDVLVGAQLRNGLAPDPLLRLASLLPEQAMAGATARLRLSNPQQGRLRAALARDHPIARGLAGQGAHAAIHAIGGQAVADRAMLAWAAEGPGGLGDPWLALKAEAEAWRAPRLPVTGDDAVAAGAARGPAVGAALRAVEAWWIEGDFSATRAQALEKLRSVVQDQAS